MLKGSGNLRLLSQDILKILQGRYSRTRLIYFKSEQKMFVRSEKDLKAEKTFFLQIARVIINVDVYSMFLV